MNIKRLENNFEIDFLILGINSHIKSYKLCWEINNKLHTSFVKNRNHLHPNNPKLTFERFTHIDDTIECCIYAWKKNKCLHYSISSKKSFSILQVAKIFSDKIQYLPERRGERYASALTDMNLSNKVYKHFGKTDLKDYIKDLIKK